MTASPVTGRGTAADAETAPGAGGGVAVLPRREFLKLLGLSAGAAVAAGCDRTWAVPERLIEAALRGPGLETEVQTVCGLCEGACGLSVRLVDGLPVGIRGNVRHPLNAGGVCPVGQAALDVLYAPERLRAPAGRGADGRLAAADWEATLEKLASRLRALAESGDGGRVALLDGTYGRFLGDLAQRFVGALGSPHYFRAQQLDTLAFSLSQGIEELPSYDLARADVVLSFGLDLFEAGPTPLHAISALVGSRETERLATVLHVGTRLSPSASQARRFVTVRPGTHAAFALGVAHVLVREGRFDSTFVAQRTSGFEDWVDGEGRRRMGFRRLLLERYYPDRVAQICGCPAHSVLDVAHSMAEAEAPVALVGGEAVEGSNATWTGLAVHAVNALLGNFDRPGGVSVTPPIPLAPLPRMAATPAAGSTAWAPRVDPVEELADAVLSASPALEVLFVVGANPLYESPAGDRLRQAVSRVPTVVALGSFEDETAAVADFLLPAHLFLESWQAASTPPGAAFGSVGAGGPVVEPLYNTRHPGDVLLDLARRCGGAVAGALPWEDFEAYLQARLEGVRASGQGSIISGSFRERWIQFLEERGWRFQERRQPADFWQELTRAGGWWNPVQPLGDWARLLPTPSRTYEFHSQRLEELLRAAGREAGGEQADDSLERGIEALGLAADSDEVCLPHHEPPVEVGSGELLLHTFRPTTARGRFLPASGMLMEMFGYQVLSGWETWAEMAPQTAEALGLADGDEIALRSERGAIEAVLRLRPGAAPDTVHVPLGLGHAEGFGVGGGVGSNPLTLVLPSRDPLSGRLATTTTRVHVERLRPRAREPLPRANGGRQA